MACSHRKSLHNNGMHQLRIMIIVPALNESRTIAKLVAEIREIHPEYTVFVVDDGSTDDTARIASEAGAHVLTLPYNLGIGGAIQTGFKAAREFAFDIAVQIDGDGQHDPRYLQTVLAPVIDGRLDLCIGSRFIEKNSGFQSTFTRRFGIRFFSFLLSFLTGAPITDPTSGYRAYGPKLISLFAEHYPIDFPEPETIMTAKRHGLNIGEVPVRMRKRLGGISSIRYLKTIYYMLKVTLAILIDRIKKTPKDRSRS